MRRTHFCVLTVFLVLGSGLCQAQTAKIQAEVDKKLEAKRDEQKASLKDLIAQAMKNNPDIRVGESKVRDAEADLERTRMKVVSELTVMHAELQGAQATAENAARDYERMKKMSSKEGALVSAGDVAIAESMALKTKANVAVIQAKLAYLLGKSSLQENQVSFLASKLIYQNELRLAQEAWEKQYQNQLDKAQIAKSSTDEEFLRRTTLDLLGRTPTPEEMKEYLKNPGKDRREKWVEKLEQARAKNYWSRVQPLMESYVEGEIQREFLLELTKVKDSPLTTRLREALDKSVQLNLGADVRPGDVLNLVHDKWLDKFNLVIRPKALKTGNIDVILLAPMPVGALLQFLEDELHVVFVLRDYGIVVVSAEERLPPGAVRVIDLWKQGKRTEKPAPTKGH